MAEDLEPHILEKYNIIQRLGKGAYGVVWRAVSKAKKNQEVAIKKVFDAFHNSTDAQRTFREVMFLKELRGHENVVKLLDLIPAKNPNDLYLIFEFMQNDLHNVIRGKILEEIHKKYVTYQLLKGLKFIHSGQIIHRDIGGIFNFLNFFQICLICKIDLKPANVLLNSDCLVKIADFGLARSVAKQEEEDPQILTEYIATRWYRAPEIVLGSQKYTKAIDMWSVGCILAEMYTGKALFPGKSTLNQIELILELLDDLDSLDSNLADSLISNIRCSKRKSFSKLFADSCPEAQDLLRKLLCFNPKKRITVEEALAHPYVKDFHFPDDETECRKAVSIPINDNIRLSRHDYKEALHQFIDNIRKKTRPHRHGSKESLLRRASSKNNIHKNEKKPLRADPEAAGMMWMQKRKSRKSSHHKMKSNHKGQKRRDMKRSSSKSLLDKHRYMMENSSILKERKRELSRKKSHQDFRDSNYKERILRKKKSKSRLGDSVYDESSKYLHKSRVEDYEKKKANISDKENYYYKFLKSITSQSNEHKIKESRELLERKRANRMKSSADHNNKKKHNSFIGNHHNQDISIDYYKRNNRNKSMVGKSNGYKKKSVDYSSKGSSNGDLGNGIYNSKFLYNVILNNSKSRSKLAAYKSRKDLLT